MRTAFKYSHFIFLTFHHPSSATSGGLACAETLSFFDFCGTFSCSSLLQIFVPHRRLHLGHRHLAHWGFRLVLLASRISVASRALLSPTGSSTRGRHVYTERSQLSSSARFPEPPSILINAFFNLHNDVRWRQSKNFGIIHGPSAHDPHRLTAIP